jgi:hypothetical protein
MNSAATIPDNRALEPAEDWQLMFVQSWGNHHPEEKPFKYSNSAQNTFAISIFFGLR